MNRLHPTTATESLFPPPATPLPGIPSQSERTSRLLWSVLALLGLSLLLLFLCDDNKINLYDEGIILTGADRVAQGAVVHRDFYFLYGPAQLQILAWLFKIFSPSVLIEREWDALVRSAIVVLIFLIGTRVMPRATGWTVAIASLIWLARFDFHGYPVFPALAAIFAGVLCLLRGFASSRSTYWLVAAGICGGVAFLFRYDMGLAVFGVESMVLAAYWLSNRSTLPFVPFAFGFASVTVPLAAAYVHFGILRDFVFDVFSFPARYYYSTRSLPFPGFSALRAGPSQIGVYLPVVVLAASLPAILDRLRAGRRDCRFWATVTIFAVTAALFLKGVVRVSLLHLGAAIVSSLVLLAMLSVGFKYLGPLVRAAVTGALFFAVVCTAVAGYGDLKSSRANLAAMMRHDGCPASADLERFGCYSLEPPAMDAIRFLEGVTDPGDYLFVGAGRHDKIFCNDVAFYFLAGQRPATKWYQFDPGLQTDPQRQREMTAELSLHRPPYILLDSEWDNWSEPNDSAKSSGATILDDYIHAHFTPAARFGTISILRNSGR